MNEPLELVGQLGRYVIIRKLGAGGMGTVYLAEDTRLSRKVALKVPHFSAADANALERFRREAALAAGIVHPNLCPVHDLEEVNGVVFFTMPYLEGTPLSNLIVRGNFWPTQKALEIVRKIAVAVAHLHAQGIIHRDLKPSNVLICPSGEPVLMDFGLARNFTSQHERLTATGTAIGSPAYMSPEQAAGNKDMSTAVDVYGLSVMLFELLTGRLPFEAPMPSLYAQILRDPPPPPSRFREALVGQLDALCLKGLSKNPEMRQPSAAAFLQELTAVIASHTSVSDPDSAIGQKSAVPLTVPPNSGIPQTTRVEVPSSSAAALMPDSIEKCVELDQQQQVAQTTTGEEYPRIEKAVAFNLKQQQDSSEPRHISKAAICLSILCNWVVVVLLLCESYLFFAFLNQHHPALLPTFIESLYGQGLEAFPILPYQAWIIVLLVSTFTIYIPYRIAKILWNKPTKGRPRVSPGLTFSILGVLFVVLGLFKSSALFYIGMPVSIVGVIASFHAHEGRVRTAGIILGVAGVGLALCIFLVLAVAHSGW